MRRSIGRLSLKPSLSLRSITPLGIPKYFSFLHPPPPSFTLTPLSVFTSFSWTSHHLVKSSLFHFLLVSFSFSTFISLILSPSDFSSSFAFFFHLFMLHFIKALLEEDEDKEKEKEGVFNDSPLLRRRMSQVTNSDDGSSNATPRGSTPTRRMV